MLKSRLSILAGVLFMLLVMALPVSAAEYKNAEIGFSVSYPDGLSSQPANPGVIYYAIAPTKMPWFTVSYLAAASFEEALKAAFVGTPEISDVTFKPVRVVDTDSGIKATATQTKYMWQNTYECEGVTFGVQKNGKWILVSIATVPMYDPSFSIPEYEKMLKTLKVN